MPGQPHSGVQNSSLGTPTYVCDLAPCILNRVFRQPTVRNHIHVKNVWYISALPHDPIST